MLFRSPIHRPDGRRLDVAVVQGNDIAQTLSDARRIPLIAEKHAALHLQLRGDPPDLAVWPEDELEYRRLHSERSAQIVGEWLRGEGADEELVAEVERLIVAHETGGAADEDLVQAADSLSFLEVNPKVLAGWYTSGRASKERAKAQGQWMFERIKIGRARELARQLYEEAIAVVDRA